MRSATPHAMRESTLLAAQICVALAAQLSAQEPAGLAATALVNPRFAWQPRSVPGFRVYFQANSYASRHQDSLLARLPAALHHARTLIAAPAPPGPIDLFFVESREQMAQLIGGRATGFAHQAARAVFLMTDSSWRAFERHEVMHIVAWHAWGPPAANNDWLQEGIAQAADGHCGNYSNNAALRGLTARLGWISLQDLLTRFRQQPDLRAYLQAASFTGHLLETFGPAAVAELWRRGATPETVVGTRTLAAIERDWRAQLVVGALPRDDELTRIAEIGCGVASPPR